MSAPPPPPRILLIEDNQDDVLFFRQALGRTGSTPELLVADEADDALAQLRDAVDAGRRPSLIVLDLNLPGTNGHELLAALKRDADFRTIPVIVLTTSSLPADVERAYAAGANAFISKPRDYESLKDVVLVLERFWLHVATLCNPA